MTTNINVWRPFYLEVLYKYMHICVYVSAYLILRNLHALLPLFYRKLEAQKMHKLAVIYH